MVLLVKKFNDIAYKHIKIHRKRSVFTLISIVISVTLFMSVGTLLISLYHNEIDNSINRYGNYEAEFSDVDKITVDKLEKEKGLSNFSIVSNLTNLKLLNGASVDLKSYDENAFKNLPISLAKGKLPDKNNEILIGDNALKYFGDPKIGNKIKLNLKNEDNLTKAEYVLCGIIKSKEYSNDESNIEIIIRNCNLPSNANRNVYFNVNSKNNIENIISNIASKYNIGSQNKNYNYNLLSLKGKVHTPKGNNIFFIVFILILVVTIATILVIYNIFNISVLERIRHYGIFRAIGANQRQIKGLVLTEGFILGIVGIPIGILLGGLTSLLSIKLLNKTMISELNDIKLSFSPIVISICIALSFAAIFLSILVPCRKAAKISPLEAITNNKSVEKIKMKKINFRLTRKILGEEAEIAFKNMQRNKGRCLITISSLIITLVLFIVTCSLNFYGEKEDSRSPKSMFDYIIYNNNTFNNDTLKEIKEQRFINNAHIIKTQTYYSLVEENKINKKYFEHFQFRLNEVNDNGINYSGPLQTGLLAYDEEQINECKKYLIQGNISLDQLTTQKCAMIFLNDKVNDFNQNKYFNEKIANIKVGDEIVIDNSNNCEISYGKKDISEGYKVKIIAILNNLPLIDTDNEPEPISLITTDKIFTDITHIEGFNRIGVKFRNGANKDEALNYFKNLITHDSSISFFNNEDFFKEIKQEYYTKKAFLYSFAITIFVIGILNIYSTITSNIILRSKEFATLKAIGMNEKSIFNIILIEGIVYGLASIIIGTALGISISYLIYKRFNNIREMPYNLPTIQIIECSIALLVVTIVTVFLSSRKLKNINIIECLKNEE